MQVKFTASKSKYSQTPKSPIYRKFRYCETKKNVILPFMHTKFWKIILRNTGGFPNESIQYCQRRQKLNKNRDTHVTHSFFITEPSRNNRKPPSRMFSGKQKLICNIFLTYPLCGSPKTFAVTNGQRKKLSKTQETSRKTNRSTLLQFLSCDTQEQKVFDIFWY